MSEEKRRQFDRLLRQERMRRRLRFAPTLAVGAGAACGFVWLVSRSAPPWLYLAIAAAGALAKPALFLFRYAERRRRRRALDDDAKSGPPDTP